MSPSSRARASPVLKPGLERRGVHGVVIGLGRDSASQTQAEDEGDRLVMAVQNAAAQTSPAPWPTVTARHAGRRRGLVDEHQSQGIEVESGHRTAAAAVRGRRAGPVRSYASTFFERDVEGVNQQPVVDGDAFSPRARSKQARILASVQSGSRHCKAHEVMPMRLHPLRTRITPHQGSGAPLPRSRNAATHRIALAKLIPNRRAAARQPVPSSPTAETTRLGKSTDKAPSRAASDPAASWRFKFVPIRESQAIRHRAENALRY